MLQITTITRPCRNVYIPNLSNDGLRPRVEANDGEPLVCEDAVAEAVDAVPVGAAVPDRLRQADHLGAVALHAAPGADPEHGQDPAHT